MPDMGRIEGDTMDRREYQHTVRDVHHNLDTALLYLGRARSALEQTVNADSYYPDALGGLAHMVSDAEDKAVCAFQLADFSVASALCGE